MSSTVQSLHVPIVDISPSNAQAAEQLVEAATDYGFVFINGQDLGFNSQILDDVFQLVWLRSSLFQFRIISNRTR